MSDQEVATESVLQYHADSLGVDLDYLLDEGRESGLIRYDAAIRVGDETVHRYLIDGTLREFIEWAERAVEAN
ncbi:hypothetical protein [Haloarchaeobius litoreus]|uniref:Uncharacterized protein n=1 Tax=Haloarchaeobius litoreus TaxID=755306 RepID=A0ABD6DMS5_9EURY|nr:hypothetical protein [Haloarchaeobius litoreus]